MRPTTLQQTFSQKRRRKSKSRPLLIETLESRLALAFGTFGDAESFGLGAEGESISGVKWFDDNLNGRRETKIVTGVQPDVLFVIDISGSTTSLFQGTESVGDQNGDGSLNRILDAEIAGFKALNEELVRRGLGNTSQVGIISFDTLANRVVLDQATGATIATPLQDRNGNQTSDIAEALSKLRSTGSTNYKDAFTKAVAFFESRNTPLNEGNLIFLSDGAPSGDLTFDVEVAKLKNRGVNVLAFGVGTGSSLPQLTRINPNAVKFTSTDDLLRVFRGQSGSGVGFLEPGTSGVTIFLDLNDNGVVDASEPTTVTRGDDPLTAADESGAYSFPNIAPGTYVVRELLAADQLQTFPGSASGFRHVVTVTAGQQATGIDFGNHDNRLAVGNRLEGVKWNDLNGDGVRDPLEPLLAGWTIYLDLNENGILEGNEPQRTTDQNGSYSFFDLAPGTYVVAEVVQSTWEQTYPLRGFAYPIPYAADVISSHLTSGDLNGDGNEEILVTNDHSATLSVLRPGTGNQLLAPAEQVRLFGRPQAVTALDVDGDQDLDVVVSSVSDPLKSAAQPDGIQVLVNDGSGKLTSQREIRVGNGAIYLQHADLNADGNDDLLLASFRNGTVQVLINRGGGNFELSQTVEVGGKPVWITSDDFDGDGDADAAVADAMGQVQILINDVHGQLVVEQRLVLGSNLSAITTGDFDNDSVPDLAVSDYLRDAVIVLLNQGRARFAAQTPVAVGARPRGLRVVDLNNDNRDDLVVALSESGRVAMLFSDAVGGFRLRSALSAGSNETAFATDVNHDGFTDLVASDLSRGVAIMLGQQDRHRVTMRPGDFISGVDFGNHRVEGEGEIPPLKIDVNRDGQVTSGDALLIVNALNRLQAGTLANVSGSRSQFDSNRDGLLTPLDVLMVVNYLNNAPTSSSSQANRSNPINELESQYDSAASMLDPLAIAADQLLADWNDDDLFESTSGEGEQ